MHLAVAVDVALAGTVLDRRLSCRNPSNGHTVRRARDVIEACIRKKRDARRVTAMLAANAGSKLLALLDGLHLLGRHLDELPDALLVDGDEGVDLDDLLLQVLRQKMAVGKGWSGVEEGEMRVRKESGQVENIKMGFAACV
jgi:hypothetical protein